MPPNQDGPADFTFATWLDQAQQVFRERYNAYARCMMLLLDSDGRFRGDLTSDDVARIVEQIERWQNEEIADGAAFRRVHEMLPPNFGGTDAP